MELLSKKIGFAFTGSFCTFDEALVAMRRLKDEGADIIPIFSYHTDQLQTRYISGAELKAKVKEITGKDPLTSIVEVEPFGPQKLVDCLVIAPATGNTISKLANGITDTPALMAAKSTMRNQRPVIIAASTNDGLGLTMKNIGLLMDAKNIYFVPFGQDGPGVKPTSILSKLSILHESVKAALDGKQLQPVLLGANEL